MKNSLKKIAFLLFFSSTALNASSQDIHTGQKAEELFPGTEMVRESRHSTLPSYLRMKASNRIPAAQLSEWMKEKMGFSSDIGFSIINTDDDPLGFTHVRMRQTYKGLPVEAATWISHSKNNQIHSMNGMIFKEISASTTPSISEEEALTKAKEFVGASQYKWEIPAEEEHLKWESGNPEATYYPEAELVFAPKNFELKAESYRLAYKFNIYAQQPLYRAHVFVDAITGEVIGENMIIHHADTPGTATTVYSGVRPIIGDSFVGGFRLRDGSRGLGIRTFDLNNAYGYAGADDFVDDDNDWDNVNPEQDEYAGDAHWGTEVCYDYFDGEHGRNSIDNAGFQLNSYVHYGVNYVNAFWDGTRMTYGDGNGMPYTPLTSLDIAGHEITHGLTNFTANLIYYGESGALNESFSDIFGTAIENYARPGDWDWLLSADIGASFRSLEDPNLFGHPDTYFGLNWAPLIGADNGGVHTNSGVQNYWYYLLVEGAAGVNDNGDAFDVNGLGFNSASAIAFRNLTVYLTDGSDHTDARFFGIQSAIDLFGECSVEERETTNAWYAVGVGPEYESSVTAEFDATIGCFPEGIVEFTDASIADVGVLDTWAWDFGDGETSPESNPTHTFDGTGTYPVELTVTSDDGCEDVFTFDVEVFDSPTVDFSVTDFCEGDLTNFTDETTIPSGAITGWDWDFGDASSSDLTNPTHTFDPFGTYDVKLVATADNGCADSLTLPVTIGASPLADFSFEDGCFDLDAAFENLSVSPDGELITDFSWDFGDASPPDLTESPSHLYTDPGTYDVTLDITSAVGCSSSITYTINRFDVPVANFTVDDICIGSEAPFTDLSDITDPEIIASLDWIFGDGETGLGAEPIHVYTESGTFDVNLTATSENGCTDEITLPINVYPNPVANFSATEVCENGDPTFFTDLSTISGGGAIDSWAWDFTDGGFAAVEDPIKKFSGPGTYDVELTVISDFGCEDAVVIPVTVFEKPNAAFTTIGSPDICSPECIDFVDLSSSTTADITGWRWEVEDGSISNEQNPNMCFSAIYDDQLYDIQLISTNGFGCSDTAYGPDFITVTATPIAAFDCTPIEIDIFDPSIEITNRSENGFSFVWDFGDPSSNSTEFEPDHTYPEVPGEYTITLEAISQNGLCSDFAQKTIRVKDIVIYYIPNTFTPDGDTYNETFSPSFVSGYNPYDFHLAIYNRWGEVIFETYDASRGWDGTYGDGAIVPPGVYVWTLDFRETQTDKKHQSMGHLNVLY